MLKVFKKCISSLKWCGNSLPAPPPSKSWWNEGEAFDFQVMMNFNNHNNLMIRCLTCLLWLDREYSNMSGVVNLSSGSQQQSNRQPPPSTCCSISWVDRSIQYFTQQIVHILNAKFWVVHVICLPLLQEQNTPTWIQGSGKLDCSCKCL